MQKVREFGNGSGCWTEPGEVSKELLANSLRETGLDTGLKLDPATTNQSLRKTMANFIDVLRIKKRGEPIQVEPLDEKQVVGFEATRLKRGKAQNEREHVVSIVLTDSGVSIVDPCSSLPYVHGRKAKFEEALTKDFQRHESVMPVSKVTSLINSVIMRNLDGILCRRAGIVYFVPPWGSEKLEQLAEKLYVPGENFGITTESASLFSNERSFHSVLTAFRAHVSELLGAIEIELAELDGQPYERGTQSRLAKITATREQIQRYEDLLGQPLQDLKDMADKTEQAVNLAAVVGLSL